MSKVNRHFMFLTFLLFVGSFAVTVATRSQTTEPVNPAPSTPLAQWLHLEHEQATEVDKHDPQFAEDVRKLRETLANERARLITLFENIETSDEELRQQIEVVIDAHNQVELRVADYLITVRHHLTPAQQQRLFSLCAENIRYCWREQRWRSGRGPGHGGAGRPGDGQPHGGFGQIKEPAKDHE
jgi:hypothetical protein